MSTVPDDLDSLLASLLSVPVPVAAPAPVPVANALPTLTPAAVRVIEQFRGWLDSAEPAEIWKPVAEADGPEASAEPLDADTLLELAAARAWRSGDHEAFEKALVRLPADRAEHHRRVAAACERSRMRHEARAQLKGDGLDHPPPLAPPH